MKNVIIVILLVLLLFVIFSALAGRYTNIVERRAYIYSRWAEVDEQIQRRNEPIIKLFKILRASYEANEKHIMGNMRFARSKWVQALTEPDRVDGAELLDRACTKMILAIAKCPDLNANPEIIKLREQIAEIENRLGIERIRYNEAVKMYDLSIAYFPDNIVAAIFKLRPAEDYYFHPEKKPLVVPDLSFN